MQVILKHITVARESATEVLAGGEKALLRFTTVWKASVSEQDRLAVLAVRSQLLDYMAACHLQNDSAGFSNACDELLKHAESFVERIRPASEVLLVEISLALILKRRALGRALAKNILGRGGAGPETLERFQARSLAELLDLNYPAVQLIAAALIQACKSKAFNKSGCSTGMLWATAVQQLANGNGTEATMAVQELQQQHIRNMDRELAKLERGGASAFAPFDLLDLPVAALMSLNAAAGYASPPVSEAAQACGYTLGLSAAPSTR